MKEILSSIFFLGVVGASLWGFNHWQKISQEAQNTQPSIQGLSTETADTKANEVLPIIAQTPQIVETKKDDAVAVDSAKESLEINVLNSGAVKGSAAKVQDFLKKSGYAKVNAGSAKGNYTGTVVYYLNSNDVAATAVQQLLKTDYPHVQIKLAPLSTTEDGSAPIVVMLGKE